MSIELRRDTRKVDPISYLNEPDEDEEVEYDPYADQSFTAHRDWDDDE